MSHGNAFDTVEGDGPELPPAAEMNTPEATSNLEGSDSMLFNSPSGVMGPSE